jgi:hypothetical protein
MPRTTTKKVTESGTKLKKTIQKGADQDKAKKARRRGKTGRFVYEVKKGSKITDTVIKSHAKPLYEEALAHACRGMINALLEICPEKSTIKSLQAKCAIEYWIAANCPSAYEELIPILGKRFAVIEERLRTDKESTGAEK